jgi:hypothetical protein
MEASHQLRASAASVWGKPTAPIGLHVVKKRRNLLLQLEIKPRLLGTLAVTSSLYRISNSVSLFDRHRMNLNFPDHVYCRRQPLWSSDQSSWLQIQGSGFDSQRYQISWEVVGLERGPLSLLSTTEELLGRKSSGSSLENREHGRRDQSRWPRGTLYQQKLALTSPTSGGRSVGIDRSRTQAAEFFMFTVDAQKHIWSKFVELFHKLYLQADGHSYAD